MEWIKMRGALLTHPKVVAIARLLRADPAFCAWLLPASLPFTVVVGTAGPLEPLLPVGSPAKIWNSSDELLTSNASVTQPALLRVTLGALLVFWSAARAHGRFVGVDLRLEHSTISDVDDLAGCPGLGRAMLAVGWLTNGDGLTLRNFKEFNVPKTNAERQAEHREKNKKGELSGQSDSASRQSRGSRYFSVTRVEKNRSTSSPPTADKAGSRGVDLAFAVDSKKKEQPLSAPARDAPRNEGAVTQATPLQEACRRTWEGYRRGYLARWHTEPLRDKQANSMIKNFCQKLPHEHAAAVAEWFCSHPRQLYLSAHHALTLLNRDANGLYTEWQTGSRQTDTGARLQDRSAERGNVFGELIAQAETIEGAVHGKT